MEDRVSLSNFYRHLEAKLDLGFVRGWVEECYAERQMSASASLNRAHRWYLGYALDEPLPDHSRLTRIRQRLGVDIFERLFERIVDLCQEAGLLWGRELFFYATKVHANAALDSLVPRFYHDRLLCSAPRCSCGTRKRTTQ